MQAGDDFWPGDVYCGFGRSTNGNACSTVQWGNYDCGSVGKQVILSLDNQVGAMHLGDSGGPWYVGTTAAGIFMGWCVMPSDGKAHLSFSKVAYGYQALGVTLMFAP